MLPRSDGDQNSLTIPPTSRCRTILRLEERSAASDLLAPEEEPADVRTDMRPSPAPVSHVLDIASIEGRKLCCCPRGPPRGTMFGQTCPTRGPAVPDCSFSEVFMVGTISVMVGLSTISDLWFATPNLWSGGRAHWNQRALTQPIRPRTTSPVSTVSSNPRRPWAASPRHWPSAACSTRLIYRCATLPSDDMA